MDFQQTGSRKAAFTLPELMCGLAIAVLCGAALAGFLFQFSRNSTAIMHFAEVNATDRHSLQVLARDFREADSFTHLSPTNLSLQVESNMVQLEYNQSAGELVRKSSDGKKILLQNCEALSFTFLQRKTDATQFESYTISTSAACRILEVRWVSLVQENGGDRWTVTNSARFLNRRGLN